jgi:ligand-binding sensor domain-containing protein/signal transduction histidine kinase
MNGAFPARIRRVGAWFSSLVWMTWAAVAPGAVPEYSARLWQMEDGLPHSIVQAIAQTQDGYLWVGTREGLARFDGMRFVPCELPGSTPPPSVTALRAGEDGSLWIGTESAGLFRLQGSSLVRLGEAEGLRDDPILSLCLGAGGRLWVGMGRGVAEWRAGRFHYARGREGPVWAMGPDRDGRLWVIDHEVQWLCDGELQRQSLPEGPARGQARSVHCDANGDVWLGTMDGLTLIRGGVATHHPKAAGPSGIVCAITRDRHGELWIGTYGGLSRFVGGAFREEADAVAGSHRVYEVFPDREGNLWVGSEGGLTRLTPRPFRTYTREHGLSGDAIAAVCAARDGSVWVSTWGGGLNRLREDEVTVFNETSGLSTDFMLAIHEGRDGSLWAGADRRGGLHCIQPGGRITVHRGDRGPVGRAITALHEARDGTLWIGTRDVLNRRVDGRFESFTTAEGLGHDKVNAICEGRDGTVWLGTDAGLTCWRGGSFTNLAGTQQGLDAVILSLHEDDDGVLWIGTKGAGLGHLRDGVFRSISAAQGLFSDALYAVIEDGQGHLWLNSSRGIFRVHKGEAQAVADGLRGSVSCDVFGRADGVLSSGQYREVTQPAACRAQDGRLWFRTTQGVAVVDPARIERNATPPPVVLEAILADRRRVHGGVPGASVSALPELVTIPPGRGELEFRYTALSLRAPEKNRFRYQLEGLDSDWIDAGDRRVAFYNRLPPGRYRFRVTASNNDGVWNDTGVTVAIVLQPFFWQTWWFLVAVCTGAAGLVGGAVRQATRRHLQRKLDRLEHQHAIEQERTRIARDLHDDLGARVTQITLLSELASGSDGEELAASTRKIAAASREITQSLDEIVWAVNPQHDTLVGLIEYLSQSADGFLEDTSLRLRLRGPDDVPAVTVPAEMRYHLFLAFREALNNVVKHAGATAVEIDLRVQPDRFEVVIADDGRGFDPPASNHGNGLSNLHQRLHAVGGRCEVRTRPEAGTTVRLTIPLHSPQMEG